jgi:hypothetical protein
LQPLAEVICRLLGPVPPSPRVVVEMAMSGADALTEKVRAPRRVVSAILAATLLLAATPAEAQRPDLRAMSCPQAQALVASRGAVVMTTGQFTFERFVAHRGFCQREETTRRAWATTGDGVRCNVAYRCEFRVRRFQSD